MNNLEDNSIVKRIEIDKNHIDQFVLETEEGTKRSREKFHREASEQRNRYVNSQISLFERYFSDIKREISLRLRQSMPQDKSSLYNEKNKEIDDLLELVKLNSNISNGFKLKLDFLISSINEDTSLEELNNIIQKFVQKFQEFGFPLTNKDFQYTMFTESYMNSFFQNSSLDSMKNVFEKIYFTCPDIKLQLKMNLEYIINHYNDSLEKYVLSLKDKLFKAHGVTSENVISKYTNLRFEVGNQIAIDEYYNTKIFLEGKKKISDYLDDSPARAKNFDTFVLEDKYNDLDEVSKARYNSAMMGLYTTLNELKKYYRYEFILKDLLEKHDNKDNVKGQLASKKKEIDKEEKKRLSIYKEFLKANGVGLFAKKNEVKSHNSMLKMNEQVRKLNTLYEELKDIEITSNLATLSESATIYDLFMVSLTSFPFLEKLFNGEESFQEEKLEDVIHEYFRFLYNPNNSVLRKINVFTDYNIVDIVAEKYKLLNLNVSVEMIDKDNIDSTMESVRFINLVQNIERSNITIHEIANICRMNEIAPKEEIEKL